MTRFQYFQVAEKKSKIEIANPFQSVLDKITENGMWKNDEKKKKCKLALHWTLEKQARRQSMGK